MCVVSFALALTAHIGFQGDYNSIHPGVRCTTPNNTIIGVYLNSEERPSAYIGIRREHANGLWIEAGAVTGYAYPVIPMVRAGYKNLFIAPGMEVGSNKVGLVIGMEHTW